MEQPQNGNKNISTTEEQFEVQLDEIKKVHKNVYDELTKAPSWVRTFQAITFLMIIFLVPLQVAFDKLIPGDYVLPERWDAVFPLGFVIAIGFANVLYLISHYRQFESFNQITQSIKDSGVDLNYQLNITETQQYRLIDLLQNTFIAGTIFAAFLWFLYPEENRLEPLTIIYGFGTALFGYFRNRFNVSNPLDRLTNHEPKQSNTQNKDSKEI
jgi:hypothetical protein